MTAKTLSLEPDSPLFPPAYINEIKRLTVIIRNNSDKVVNYEWRKNPDLCKDFECLAKFDLSNPNDRVQFEQELLFKSEIFSIEPIKAQIWPKRFQQIVITYHPKSPGPQSVTAYLYDIASKDRIPVTFRGDALPAQGKFDIEAIHIGHIDIGSVHEYQVFLMNIGKVEFDFEFIQREVENNEFIFSPISGHLEPGSKHPVIIHFKAKKVGQFNEKFIFKINNCLHNLPKISLFGRVIGPTFELSKSKVEFGKVSMGFKSVEVIHMTNTSEIPLKYSYKMIADDTFEKREFSIIPDFGILEPHATREISVEFMPLMKKEYNVQMKLIPFDTEKSEIIIPIHSQVICPDVQLKNPVINIGEVFLGVKIHNTLIAINSTKYKARYEFLDPLDASILEARITPDQKIGSISELSEVGIPFIFECLVVGPINITRYVSIAGLDKENLSFKICGHCIGPKIVLNKEKIDFGTLQLLEKAERTLILTNDSPITAKIKFSLNDTTNFSISSVEQEIQPNSSFTLTIESSLNHETHYKAKLTIYIENSVPIDVPLIAKGIGCPFVCSIDKRSLQFGHVFAGSHKEIRFTLQNRGIKEFGIKYSLGFPRTKPMNIPATFKLEPLTAVLVPFDEPTEFVMKIHSPSVCIFELKLECSQIVKTGAKKVFFSTLVTAEFIHPTIIFEEPVISFKHVHDVLLEASFRRGISPAKEALPKYIKKSTITNNTQLPMSIIAHSTSRFFDIEPKEFMISSAESVPFEVIFLTDLKTDFNTEVFNEKIIFKIIESNSECVLDIKGELHFPNLSHNCPNELDFGIIASDTDYTKEIVLTNDSIIDVVFDWEIIKNSEIDCYDICPLRGTIAPGHHEIVHFTMYGKIKDIASHMRCASTAVCHVLSGPDYIIPLKGEVAKVTYEVSQTVFDLGMVRFDSEISASLNIVNLCSVTLPFQVVLPQKSPFETFNVTPKHGEINTGGSELITFSLTPGIPKSFSETFSIRICHYDTTQITINLHGYIPQIQTDIPRHPDDPVLNSIGMEAVSIDQEPHFRGVSKILPEDESCKMLRSDLSSLEKSLFTDFILYSPNFSFKSTKRNNAMIVGSFLINMGTVVYGEVKSAYYSIKSIAPVRISFVMDTSSLQNSGITIVPSQFNGIEPEQCITFKVEINTTEKEVGALGDLEYPVFIRPIPSMAYVIIIGVSLISPTLQLSRTLFEFDKTVIGQTRSLTLQLQNPNNTPISFEFSEPVPLKITKKKEKNIKSPFKISPLTGEVIEKGFQNIMILFSPLDDKIYHYHFTLKSKYNTDSTNIILKGAGLMLKIDFEPPLLEFPPSLGYNHEILKQSVKIVNPTSETISVLSTQFDAELQKSVINDDNTLTNTELSLNTISSPLRFAMVVIVHGPPKSGVTSVCNILSQHLSLPIVKLSAFITPTSNDELLELLSSDMYQKGFIVDSLFCFSDSEDEAFIQQVLHNKSVQSELSKNPLFDIPHNHLTSIEQAFQFLIECLDGHFMFTVCLQISEDAIKQRISNSKYEEAFIEDLRKKAELEEIFTMNESEYDALPPDKQIEIDELRKIHREQVIHDLTATSTSDNTSTVSKSTNRKSRNESKRKLTGTSTKGTYRLSSGKLDDSVLSYLLYNFTVGSVFSMTRINRDNIMILDPTSCSLPSSINFSSFRPAAKAKYIYDENFIFIDGNTSLEEIKQTLVWYLPRFNIIKQNVYMMFISPPSLVGSEAIELAKKPEHFTICRDEKNVEPFPSSPKNGASKKLLSTPGSKNVSSRKNLEFSPPDLQATKDNALSTEGTPRWIIEPNSTQILDIGFFGRNQGIYTDVLTFGIIGTSNTSYKLPVKAIVGYPDIIRTPQSIFGRTVPRILPRTECAFAVSTSEFYFGNQVVLKERGKNPYAFLHSVSLSNCSPFPCEISLNLTENQNQVFFLESNSIRISPGGTSTFKIGFHPTTADHFKTKLQINVKDNPEPLNFTLSGDGCIPTVECSTTNLDFERILTNQARELPLTLNNNGKTAAYFKIKNYQSLGSDIRFSTLEGLIPPKSSTEVTVIFSPKRSVLIKKPISIDVLDKIKSRVFAQHHITVQAESFDADIELIYPKPLNHINYGRIKVSETKQIVCTLKNKGKYPASFRFVKNRNAATRLIQIHPFEGTLLPGERNATTITFTFVSNTCVKYENYGCASLRFNDVVTKVQICDLPIKLSVLTDYNRIRIDPPDALDFGLLPVNGSLEKMITITNEGLFTVDFAIESEEKESLNKRKKSPRSKNRKSMGGRFVRELYAGNFVINSNMGSLAPGQSQEICIEFSSSSATNDVVTIKVVCPHLPNGDFLEYLLKGSAVLPTIETGNISKIFQTIPSCLRYELSKVDRHAFIEDEHCLHFQATLVKRVVSIPVRIINTQPFPIIVDFLTRSTGKSHSSYFSLSEKSSEIESYGSALVDIVFAPTTVGKFFGIFEAIPRTNAKDITSTLRFNIEGISSVPTISISGHENLKNGKIDFSFGKVLVGLNKLKSFVVANNGAIPVVVTVTTTSSPDFSLMSPESGSAITLDPNRKFTLTMSYLPAYPRKAEIDVKISIQDNSSGDIFLKFTGECIYEDTIIDELVDDELTFPDTCVGSLSQIVINMRNIGKNPQYFKWNAPEYFTFYPSYGHIHAGKSKRIKITFDTEQTHTARHAKASCQIKHIVFTDPNPMDWDESQLITKMVPKSSQSMQIERPSSSLRKGLAPKRSFSRFKTLKTEKQQSESRAQEKTIKEIEQTSEQDRSDQYVSIKEVAPEPAYSYLNPPKNRSLEVKLNAVTDTIRFNINTDEIAFAPTMIYDSRIVEAVLHNTCLIRLEYQWNVRDFCCNTANNSYQPFSVEPSSGTLERGESRIFKVRFSPVEVDDYKATLVCDISHVSVDSNPKISVTGLSRRPICHFFLESSDYLTRRAPDYSSAIPDGAKVVEIFSSGVNQRSIKKFEILNTTNEGYNIEWSCVIPGEGISVGIPTAFVSPGRRHSASFTYVPKNKNVIESLWQFNIPSHEIKVFVLVVGRMMLQ